MTTLQLPVIEQFTPPSAAPPPAADASVGLDDAEAAMDGVQRFTELLERVVGSMSKLIEARTEARRDAGRNGDGGDHAVNAAGLLPATASIPQQLPEGAPLPPPIMPRFAAQAAGNSQPVIYAPPPPDAIMQPPMPQQAAPAPPPEPPPSLDELLTDEAIDRVFDLAIGYARQHPDETFARGATDLESNRALVRRVVRKAITEDGG